MRNFFTTWTSHDFFRVALLLFAVLLGGQSIWILTAEILRPSSFELPTTAQAAVTSADRNAAARAASFGVVRGDLWAEYALTYLDLLEIQPVTRR